jgi:DNA-binding NtrC family response regulator
MARILIVDDDTELLFPMSEYLNAGGFETKLASSAAQVPGCLARSRFDLIVSDFSMPGESGLDLPACVSSRYSGLLFVMMSGSGMSRLRAEAMKRGSSGYVQKPFAFKDLVGTLDSVLRFAPEGPGLALIEA